MDALKNAVEALRSYGAGQLADAERYRWLRDQCPDFKSMNKHWIYENLDRAIDAAIDQARGEQL